ncbi:unnamed protein product [Spodoptera littoralis]|uniref:Protein borderless n=1 Tax=Spodoptera littoralis TaxID=7109 RepID=A0A9P0IHK8_SPOLI|nr:unnamed protein product [Spodoptera littoralis]CAH1646879.1 unnamed protein product [Spodoptera littoralis]
MWVLRALAALAASVAAAASLLPLDAEHLHASVGGFAVMNCHLDFPFGNEIPYHLQWDKDGESIFSWYSGEGAARVADRWGGRVRRVDGPALGRGSINVSAVRETDAGLYRCRVTFPNRTPPARNNGTFYYLQVDGGNLIVTPPMNVTVLEGERAELECLPKSPESAVEWYKDGTPLGELPELALRSERPANGSLVLRRAASTDPGEYECRVHDPAYPELQSASAFLDVQYKAKVVYAPKERFLPYGKPASLDCHFSANPPLTNLRWEKDGFLFDPYNVPGVFYSRNGSLLFNQVDESHEGEYSCTPYNSLGSAGPSTGVRVRVQRPPALAARPQPLYVARLGATLTLPCAAAARHRDQPLVHWARKDGSELPAGRHNLDDGNLTIVDVTEDDRGVYVCTVSNEAATVDVETELLVENMPPRAPYNLTVRPSTDSIHLSWVPGHNGLEVDYNVWYRERTVSEWRTMKILTRGVTEATLVGLRPGTEYELRVLSQDLIGDGLFSKPVFARTVGSSDEEGIEAEQVAYAAATTEETEPGASSEGVDGGDLDVTVRLIDEGALVRWRRDPTDGTRCTLRWYEGAPPGERLLATGHTLHDYMLVSGAEEGARYWARVQCASGASGGAALRVPEYARLRGVAAGCAAAALLLAALAAALLAARRRLCARPPPPARADKRLR